MGMKWQNTYMNTEYAYYLVGIGIWELKLFWFFKHRENVYLKKKNNNPNT